MSNDDDKITWNQTLETGIVKIDEQHRTLIDTINKAHRLVSQNYSLQNIQSVMKDLIYYTQFHFETEEELMESSGYFDTRPNEYEQHIDE
ncbi:MAG: hypothetical protein JXQ76_12430, partial [Campylobacterales bacterium]|nr:hypothetical protein [Campylobacterales bacterium]